MTASSAKHLIIVLRTSYCSPLFAVYRGLLRKSALLLLLSLSVRAFSFPSPDNVFPNILSSLDEVRIAYLPNNLNDAIAVGAAESIAGAVGGLASRGTANVLGDDKIDSLKTKLQSTSAFFGTRGLLMRAGHVLGIPQPLTLVVAGVLGSLASEATKKAGRNEDINRRSRGSERPLPQEMLDQKQRQQGLESLEDTSGSGNAIESPLRAAETTGDITKWLTYDLLFQAIDGQVPYPWEVPLSFASGAVAAAVGLLVFDLLDEFSRNQNKRDSSLKLTFSPILPPTLQANSSSLLAYKQTSAEGAILFGVYQLVYDLLGEFLPDGVRYEFPFYKLLGVFEDSRVRDLF